ncbi:putative ribonuclease H-like domain-containing protein [Tanacetum coccineum]
MWGGTPMGKVLAGRSDLMENQMIWVSEMNENGGLKGKDFDVIYVVVDMNMGVSTFIAIRHIQFLFQYSVFDLIDDRVSTSLDSAYPLLLDMAFHSIGYGYGFAKSQYGYRKNHKKTVKIGQTRTRERKENTRAERMLSRGGVCLQPPGFEDPQYPDKVYKVYVDDIIFGSTKKSLCVEFEQMMHKRFQMSSIGELTFFLGLQVKQKDDGIFINQDKYVADILKKFDFSSVKTASTLMEPNKALIKDAEVEDVDVHLYRSMIGSLMYITASRPDIMFVVCACARFQVTPKVSHLHAVKRIFRYLKGQSELGLWYPRDSPFDLEAFSDSDYAGASLDRKSTTGGCQFLSKRLISWQCKKQTIVANSTTKAEYVATANCCGQVLWIQNQMLDYGFNFMNTKIYIDNESTICIVKNLVFHSKTKHIEIRHHFIRDSYEKRLIKVIKIHTDHNAADLLTKAFDVSRFNFLIASIGLLNL